MPFTPKKLALLISSLYLFSPLAPLLAAEPAAPNKEEVAKPAGSALPTVVVVGKRNTDTAGRQKVYEENVSNLYVGREELARVQASNPADVLKGINGVYSMDARNGSAITPNVRGLSGEGRVPLTVDGTEQSTNVWLQVYGVGNRNYVDPAMFRSIAVEKGPSLSRDVKSGVGGAINIRTIEASDIIADGRNVGVELRLETAGNSVKPQVDANSYFGRDYRDIPGATLGSDNNVNIPQPVPRNKGNSSILNFDDHAEMLTIAGRNAVADLLVSYSQREKGNYFAGSHGADAYSHNNAYAKDTAAYYPNLTKLYRSGNEVLSTASRSQTTLLKNNWYLPGEHKLGLSAMRSELRFAETSPGQSIAMLGIAEELAKQGRHDQLVAEYPHSELRLDTYKLSHEWKPAGSPWINLQSSLWQTKADGVRHQTGSGAYYIKESSALNDYGKLLADWNACRNGPDWANGLPSGAPAHTCFTNPQLNPNLGATTPVKPDHDGTIFAGSAQWTRHQRSGFDVSNQMRLADNLRLTLGGGLQQEKLDERVADVKLSGGIGASGATFHYATANYGPRSGTRREASAIFNFEWEPTSWLSLSAGSRYNRYSADDTGLAERRRQQLASAQAVKQRIGLALQYGKLMTDAERAQFDALLAAVQTAEQNIDYDNPAVWKTWDVYAEYGGQKEWLQESLPTEDPTYKAAYQALADYAAQHGATPAEHIGQAFYRGVSNGLTFRLPAIDRAVDWTNTAAYWQTTKVLPVVNGKVDASQSPFASGELSPGQTVQSPQGAAGTFNVVGIGSAGDRGQNVYATIAPDQAWAAPQAQSGHAWSPVLSATVRPSPYSTIFLRHAQTTRFPSIFEVASTSVGLDGVGALAVNGASKPERSINWELGYGHDLTQFFSALRQADVRLSYFNTVIKDFIERDATLSVIQFDKKKTSGIELQSRFDSGGFFGSLGATYRRKQQLCDANYAYGLDPYYNRMPKCMTGGFPDMLTATSLQPRYSINLELGARLLNERLEMGLRSVYHAKAENPQLDALLNTSYGKDIWKENSMRQLYWRAVLLHDVYARWSVDKALEMNLKISNLTDRYYMDPMSKIPSPGPGRTLSVGLRARF